MRVTSASALLIGVMLAAASWSSLRRGAGQHGLRVYSKADGLEVKDQEVCGLTEVGMEYHTSKPIYTMETTFSADSCCAICEGDPRCGVWTWGRRRDVVGLTNMCFLRTLAEGEKVKKVKRHGVISGMPSSKVKKHGFKSAVRAEMLRMAGIRPQNAAILQNQTCPGTVTVAGEDQVSLVSALWAFEGQPAALVEVMERDWVIPHLGSRSYFASNCTIGTYSHNQYTSFMLLGQTLRYTTDVSTAGCGCNAKISLIPLRKNNWRSKCSDYYCDSKKTCGIACAEIAVQQSNQYAWSTSLHIHDDAEGQGVGYGGGTESNGRREWTDAEYGPGAECIDTSRSFEVAISFPVGGSGKLQAVELVLTQAGSSCPLRARLDQYDVGGVDGFAELSELLGEGVTPVVSYVGAHNQLLMDGLGLDGKGPCIKDSPEVCPDSVRFYGFTVGSITRSSPEISLPGSGVDFTVAPSTVRHIGVQAAIHHIMPNNNKVEFRKLQLPLETVDVDADIDSRNAATNRTADTLQLLDASTSLDDQYGSALEWEVVGPGFLQVHETKELMSHVLQEKLEGSIVVGRRDGEWLALLHEPGFIKISVGTQVFLKARVVSYAKLSHGNCEDANLYPIYDAFTCQNAGFALGYFDVTVGIYWGRTPRPEGCYIYEGQLWLSTNGVQIGKGTIGERFPICSSKSYPTTTSTTTTTATTTRTNTMTLTITTSSTSTITTTSTTTWGWPSLFCLSVVRTKGYEYSLVKEQQREHASIFSCDEYAVFSDGAALSVGTDPTGKKIMTIVIPPIKERMGDLHMGATTDSWLNTETFLQVWDLAKKDGRFERHDWTAKVDPDAVFFPVRLRNRLKPHTQQGGNMFVMNCDRYNPVALYGSLEIYSKKALQTYVAQQWTCRNELPWRGWGEDFFMSHCMDRLGVQRLYDFTLIGDKRCHYAPCTDISKVVYHDYKGSQPWFTCYAQSKVAERNQHR